MKKLYLLISVISMTVAINTLSMSSIYDLSLPHPSDSPLSKKNKKAVKKLFVRASRSDDFVTIKTIYNNLKPVIASIHPESPDRKWLDKKMLNLEQLLRESYPQYAAQTKDEWVYCDPISNCQEMRMLEIDALYLKIFKNLYIFIKEHRKNAAMLTCGACAVYLLLK